MKEKILKELSDAFGYEVPECDGTELYFHLMAIQVGSLAHPEAKDQVASLNKIRLLCELCELILVPRSKVIDSFIDVFTGNKGAFDENQPASTSENTKRKCNCTECEGPYPDHDGCGRH